MISSTVLTKAYECPNNGFAGWETLYSDLAQTVFSYLDKDTRISLRSVCKIWKSLVSSPNIFFSHIIDVRTVPDLPKVNESYFNASKSACKGYRNLRAVVQVLGGWEKYHTLPVMDENGSNWPHTPAREFNFFGIHISHPSEPVSVEHLDALLIAPVVRIKQKSGLPCIAFRHINSLGIGTGYMMQNGPSGDYPHWYITFDGEHNFPRIRMKRELGPCDIDPEEAENMDDEILHPMQVLKELFSRPAVTREDVMYKFDSIDTTNIEMKSARDHKHYTCLIVLLDEKKGSSSGQ